MATDTTKLDASPVEVGPNAPAFQWTERRERAAFLLAEDELTDEQIAAECGVTRQTLATWKRRGEFRDRMSEHVKALESAIVHIGVTRKRNRIARLQRVVDRLEALIEARAADREYNAPGQDTGLVVSKPIFSAKGDALEYEHKFDAALVREYRATLEQVAKELGQLSEKIEIEQETIVRRYVGVDMEDV
jgi:transcriptional regulator with XRE-family HTH domain